MKNTIKLYGLCDEKVGEFNQPFVAQNDQVAIRQFGDAIVNAKPDSLFGMHPEDFTLWYIGLFDVNDGVLLPLEKPTLLARGADFVVQENK